MSYSIIYADPPWAYKVWSKKGNGRSAESHYLTMKDVSIIDISKIANKNCVLFMWATFPCLQEAIELGKKWGFTYKTVAFTWVKKNKKNKANFFGMGYYTRANAEICLLFTKGKPLKRMSKSVAQIIEHPVCAHSAKPGIARKRIVELFGDIPRIELFARTRNDLFGNYEYDGWDIFGNEAAGNNVIILQ
jgi:N6-adenosine-specific RNA methylase IME4